MKVVLAPQASRDLDHQIQYLIDQHAPKAARDLNTRVMSFLRHTLATTPRFGVFIDHRELFETWIPCTRLVIWYRVGDDTIEIARFWLQIVHSNVLSKLCNILRPRRKIVPLSHAKKHLSEYAIICRCKTARQSPFQMPQCGSGMSYMPPLF